jgi:hypothetical protein
MHTTVDADHSSQTRFANFLSQSANYHRTLRVYSTRGEEEQALRVADILPYPLYYSLYFAVKDIRTY